MYESAHLVVAAVRIIEHLEKAPPGVEQVAEMLDYSVEETNRVVNKLVSLNVLSLVEGGFGTRILIRDHKKLEEIPGETGTPLLEDEIARFQNQKKELNDKIKTIREQAEKRKKELFSDIESKFKGKLDS